MPTIDVGAFVWGYGHYFVFAGAAAVGAGIAVAVDQATDHSTLSDTQAGFVLTMAATTFLLAVWLVTYRFKPPGPIRTFAVPVASVLILLTSFTAEPVLFTGFLLAALVVLHVVVKELQPERADESGDDRIPDIGYRERA